jgi:hypothetical protein
MEQDAVSGYYSAQRPNPCISINSVFVLLFMIETGLSAESEEILDTTTFSKLALLGLLLALAGVFSLQYTQVMPFSILGAVLGAISLLLAKRNKSGLFSKVLGVLAVCLGTTVISTALSSGYMAESYDLGHARKVCELYLESISKGEMNRVYFLAGFDPASALQTGSSEAKQAITRLKTDPVHIAIRGRKTPAKWVFVRLEGESPSEGGAYTYRLKYRDEGQPNKPSYILSARKTSGKFDKTKDTVNWFVDNLVESN